MADKFSAFGAVLTMGGTDDIANIKDISGPELTQETEDVTTHDQATPWREKIGTLLDAGDVTLELVFDPGDTTHAALLAQMVGRTSEAFDLKINDTNKTMWSFDAFVTKFSPKEPVDGALTASCSITITGEITLSNNWSS